MSTQQNHSRKSRQSARPEGFCYVWPKANRKDGKVIVAKATSFYGSNELVLGVVWRNQRGCTKAVSLPRPVLLDAQRRGLRWVYVRSDRDMWMKRTPLEAFLKGRLQPDHEHYVLLQNMEPCEWRAWYFTDRMVEIRPDEPEEPQTVQLSLFGAAA